MKFKNYKSIQEYVLRNGGNNNNGRISKSFFKNENYKKNSSINLRESLNPNIPRPYALSGTEDLSVLDQISIDIIGGCEASYMSKYLKSLNFRVRHSFENHSAMEPYGELNSPNTEFLHGDANIALFSQVQILRPLINRMQADGGYISKEDMKITITEIINALNFSICKIRETRNVKIWILTHPGYHISALGFHDYRINSKNITVFEFLTNYKLALYDLAKQHSELYILDVDLALERLGKIPNNTTTHIRLHETLGGHFERRGAEIVAEDFIRQLFLVSKKVKRIKCAVVDCDNTLWKGILREDGINNLKIDRIRFQRLWHIAQRGIPIALCSKNDPEDESLIMDVVKRYGKLNEKIVATRINWNPKSANIQSIADELNIGIDTIAFFDDNEFERDEVSKTLPMVRVFKETDLNSAPELPIFHPLGDFTEENLTRVQKYKENIKRNSVQKKFGKDKFEEFLLSCKMRLEVRIAEPSELNRVAEILQRTNQMNATLLRMSSNEIQKYMRDEDKSVHIIKLGDKFGNYGIIGTSLCKLNSRVLYIRELALSCRAMGRRIEDALLEELIGFANDKNFMELRIEVTKTSRNNQIIEVLNRVGFKELNKTNSNSQNQIVMNLDLDNDRKGRKFAPWFRIDSNIQDDD
jgi:FkbH-like protein